MKMNKILLVVLLYLIIFSNTLPNAYASKEIKVFVNDEQQHFSPAPIFENGCTLVPMRPFFEALGAKIEWNSATKTVIGKRDNAIVELTINKKIALVNGKEIALSQPGKIINGNTFIPLRFVGEALGDDVDWNSETSIISITIFRAPNKIQGLGLEIKQGDDIYCIISNYEEVNIKKDNFSMRFNIKDYDSNMDEFYSAMIASVSDKVYFDLVKPNIKISNLPYFCDGSGLAPAGSKYSEMYISDDGQHYIIFDEQNPIDQRADLIKKENEFLKVEWKVNYIVYSETKYDIKDVPIGDLYLIVVIDNDLDNIIDENEFSTIKVHFI
ncbi:copper amine oxidase N-terminal domain-containing protein [Candidatus Formimonas warabiya]|uniref:Copper amine oxidase-like N-terminal domain-containing protein n=1 Tax=Formimonas warabiya TaxID=1761012 RepID=A0A3G1KSS2_FORW1|nr:copper amine oxidase N-terminal domain-containing protein [Candidatus Formimonas warabiya]ATW25522.1 hypothetical protein DCMF_12770 [Candidatus Formimonas warabiya]